MNYRMVSVQSMLVVFFMGISINGAEVSPSPQETQKKIAQEILASFDAASYAEKVKKLGQVKKLTAIAEKERKSIINLLRTKLTQYGLSEERIMIARGPRTEPIGLIAHPNILISDLKLLIEQQEKIPAKSQTLYITKEGVREILSDDTPLAPLLAKKEDLELTVSETKPKKPAVKKPTAGSGGLAGAGRVTLGSPKAGKTAGSKAPSKSKK